MNAYLELILGLISDKEFVVFTKIFLADLSIIPLLEVLM